MPSLVCSSLHTQNLCCLASAHRGLETARRAAAHLRDPVRYGRHAEPVTHCPKASCSCLSSFHCFWVLLQPLPDDESSARRVRNSRHTAADEKWSRLQERDLGSRAARRRGGRRPLTIYSWLLTSGCVWVLADAVLRGVFALRCCEGRAKCKMKRVILLLSLLHDAFVAASASSLCSSAPLLRPAALSIF